MDCQLEGDLYLVEHMADCLIRFWDSLFRISKQSAILWFQTWILVGPAGCNLRIRDSDFCLLVLDEKS